MADPVFLFTDDDTLVEMNETQYESENDLQHILAKYPKLLFPGNDDPVPLLLVRREAGIPGDEDVGDSFSLDHLFLDHDGVPTLVEVKRSTDTRIRREVVGQMLDYAANAVAYWSVDRLKGMFDATWEQEGQDPEAVITDFIGEGEDPDVFWTTVKTNLQAGKVRMIFAADTIPNRLRRIVEFLNEQMDPAEVIAVEVRQFVSGEGIRMVSPRILGQSAKAEQRKGPKTKRKWNEEDFLAELGRDYPADVYCAKEILRWLKDRKMRIWWGEGKKLGSYFPVLDIPEGSYLTFGVWTNGRIELQFQWIKTYPYFEDPDMRRKLLRKLTAIDGVDIPEDAIGRRPSFPLSALRKREGLDAFFETITWALEVYKGTID